MTAIVTKTIIQLKTNRFILLFLFLSSCILCYTFIKSPENGIIIIVDDKNYGIEGVRVSVWYGSVGSRGPFYTDKRGRVNCGLSSLIGHALIVLDHKGFKKSISTSEVTKWPLRLKFNGDYFEYY